MSSINNRISEAIEIIESSDCRTDIKKIIDQSRADMIVLFAYFYATTSMSRRKIALAIYNTGTFPRLKSAESVKVCMMEALKDISRLEHYHPEEIKKAKSILPTIKDMVDPETDIFIELTKKQRAGLKARHISLNKNK